MSFEYFFQYAHLRDMEYTICIRQEEGYCAIEYSESTDDIAFRLTRDPTKVLSSAGMKGKSLFFPTLGKLVFSFVVLLV